MNPIPTIQEVEAAARSGLDTRVIVALITAGSALVLSFINFFMTRSNQRRAEEFRAKQTRSIEEFKADQTQSLETFRAGHSKELEELKAVLADRLAECDARREYEFEARKRLYNECAPLLFTLSEMSEHAIGRISRLAWAAEEGNLEPGQSSWLNRRYFNRSTYYRLLAPIAMVKLFRSRLTHLDLSLDPLIHWQYTLCKLLADTFTDDFDLARLKPILPYHPHVDDAEEQRRQKPAVYWQQGIPRGILDNAVTALIVNNPDGATVMSYNQFEAKMDNAETDIAICFKRISYLFEDFHPGTRPVLWRVLLAQAYLYRALLLSRSKDFPPPPGEASWDKTQWVFSALTPFSEDDPDPLSVGRLYVDRALGRLYHDLWGSQGKDS